MIEVNTQTTLFLQSLLLGAALGVCYDVFRILRLAVPHGTAAVFVEDLVFFGACSVSTFLFLLTTLYGQVRVFILLGEFLGALVYYLTLSRLVMGTSRFIIAAMRWIFGLLYRVFIHPFVRLGRFLRGKCGHLAERSGRRVKKIGQTAKNNLKTHGAMLYNLSIRTHFRNKVKRKKKNTRNQSDGKGKKSA